MAASSRIPVAGTATRCTATGAVAVCLDSSDTDRPAAITAAPAAIIDKNNIHTNCLRMTHDL